MPKYQATVRLYEVSGPDKVAAQRALEQKLRDAGLGRWQIVNVTPAAPPLPVRHAGSRSRQISRSAGPLLLLGMVAWALWFYWLLVG